MKITSMYIYFYFLNTYSGDQISEEIDEFIICKQEVYKFCLLNCIQIIFPTHEEMKIFLKNVMNTLSDSIIGCFQSSVLNYLLNVKARTIRTKYQYVHILAQLLRASGTFLPLPRKKKKGNSLLR